MKRNCKYIACIIIILFVGLKSHAQMFPVNNQYFVNPYTLSPAFAGYNNTAQVFAGYRQQWMKMPESPKTAFISLVAPVWSKVWLGGFVYNDESSIFNSLYASASYTYRLQIAEKHLIRFGAWMSIRQNTINLRNINIESNNDPLLQDKVQLTGSAFNTGAGFLYQNSTLMMGFSVPNLFVSRKTYGLTSENNLAVMERNYVFYAFYQHALNERWSLDPSLVVLATKYAPTNIELAAIAKYKQQLWLGMFYRSSSIVGFTAGGRVVENITLNYSYEFSNNGFTQYTSGTHEFSIGFDLYFNKYEKPGNSGPRYPMIMNYNEKYRK
ncbi:MAG: type IX secretion system membrane protein PorP/SprF [Bacteroidales bacterium]|nr:type IX secretion system membrane protein PorP/SprF [Bacteroidales bacterium]MCF8386418.1 type IX secretion system membrane protein PorP/SprF [Bacteroidales bacterium]MCF8397128.1 type IX secretion system membrane protein PorP/SprF [Bacteroidales bacterium]